MYRTIGHVPLARMGTVQRKCWAICFALNLRRGPRVQLKYIILLLFILFYATTNYMKYPSVLSKQRKKSSSARHHHLPLFLDILNRTYVFGRVRRLDVSGREVRLWNKERCKRVDYVVECADCGGGKVRTTVRTSTDEKTGRRFVFGGELESCDGWRSGGGDDGGGYGMYLRACVCARRTANTLTACV